MKLISKYVLFSIISLSLMSIITSAQSKIEVNAGADLVSRYIWRGMDFGNSPAAQPNLSFSIRGLELGFWGSYSMDNRASGSDEIDAWLAYTIYTKDISITALVTDYYFPNAGKKLGNFNNYDNVNGSGAHTLEAGLNFTFENFPLALSAYYNFYNDSGKNTYFQVDVPVNVKNYELNFFSGATTGSENNPEYYGAENFSVIYFGVQASKSIKITEDFSLPLFVSFSLNPKLEQSYLVFGLSF